MSIVVVLSRAAVELIELSGSVENPRGAHALAFSNLCYLTGSHDMRSIASYMPVELHYTARALVSLMLITGRAVSTARALQKQMQPPEPTLRMTQSGTMEAALGRPEPFDRVRDVTRAGP